MFRKYYKEANDDIKPDRALIDKIFEKAEKRPAAMRYVYRYGTVLAAVLVLVIFAFSYEDLGKLDQTENLMPENSAVIQSSTEDTATAADMKKQQQTEDADAKSENKVFGVMKEDESEPAEKRYTAAVQNNREDTAKNDEAETDMPNAESMKDKAVQESVTDRGHTKDMKFAAESTEKPTAETEEGLNMASTAASDENGIAAYSGGESSTGAGAAAKIAEAAEVAATTDETEKRVSGSSGGGGGSSSTAMMRKMPETVIWSRDRYIEYIGLDVPNKAKVPSDMKPAAEMEFYLRADGGEVVNDAVMFVYNGEDGRNICITTGKKSSVDNGVYENSMAEKTAVNGYDAYILSSSDESIMAYLNLDGVGIAVSANGVSRGEIFDVLFSVTAQ